MFKNELIYLRKLEATDLGRTCQWLNEPEIFLIMGIESPPSIIGQQRWFEITDQARDKIVFAVCTVKNNEHIGNVSLDNIDARHRTARLSAFIANPSNRGKGLGRHAIYLLLEYAFHHLNLRKVYLKMLAENNRVFIFYKKLGFVLEGTLREHEYVNGKYVDKNLLAIFRDDFELLDKSKISL
jgi:RimJ/RimL family protein N-acetyltransferase